MNWSTGGSNPGGAGSSRYPASSHVQQSASPSFSQWIPNIGIRRDVIQADIQRYLGTSALVRPGEGRDENAGQNGYWIAAHHTLTPDMIRDLQADSGNYERSGEQCTYEDSQIHSSRQYWGPTHSSPQTGSSVQAPALARVLQDSPSSSAAQTPAGYGQYQQPYQQLPRVASQAAAYSQEYSQSLAADAENPSPSYTYHSDRDRALPQPSTEQTYARHQLTYATAQPSSEQQPTTSYNQNSVRSVGGYPAYQPTDTRTENPQTVPRDSRTAQATHPQSNHEPNGSQGRAPWMSAVPRPGYYQASDGNYYLESARNP